VLGRLTIAWGDDVVPWDRLFLVGRMLAGSQPDEVVPDFHAEAVDHRPDTWSSRYFGWVLRLLLDGSHVVVTDRAFADPARALAVEDVFRRVLPGLEVSVVKADGRLRTGLAPESAHGIEVDADVYEENEFGASDESIAVTGAADAERVLAALGAAGGRMMMTDEHGREHTDPDALAALGDEVYTPNYHSEAEVAADGSVGFYVDCKSWIGPAMAATFRRILVEELHRHGVTAAHVVNASR